MAIIHPVHQDESEGDLGDGDDHPAQPSLRYLGPGKSLLYLSGLYELSSLVRPQVRNASSGPVNVLWKI